MDQTLIINVPESWVISIGGFLYTPVVCTPDVEELFQKAGKENCRVYLNRANGRP